MEDVDRAVVDDQPTPTPGRGLKTVAIVAAITSIPFAVGGIILTVVALPTVQKLYVDMGGELPASTRLLVSLNSHGLLPLLLIVFDVAIFALMYMLAKKYWIGLLFVPVLVYAGVWGLTQLLLYLPMYQVVTQVQ